MDKGYNFSFKSLGENNKMRKLAYIITPLLLAGIFSGCGTTQMQLNSTMTRTIVLDPVKKDQKIVYLKVRNTAMSKINILPDLLKEFKKRGIRVTDDPNKAKYWLDVNVLFADNLREAQALKAATDSGITAGVATGVSSGSGRDGLIAGVLTAVVAGGIARSTEDEIYRAVIDISVKELKGTGVKAEHIITDTGSRIEDKKIAGFGNEIAGKLLSKTGGGKLNDGLVSTDSYDYGTKYVQYKTRIFVSAVQMGLKLKEAIPILEKRAACQIAEIFK